MLNQSNFAWDTDWWTASSQRVAFVPNPVSITIYCHCERDRTSPSHNALPAKQQIKLANQLFEVPAELNIAMDDVAELAREETDQAVDLSEYGLGHINRENIGKHYRINTIIIPGDLEDENAIYFLDGECDWEEEHGLRLSMKNGKFVGYSSQSGSISIRNISANAM